MKETFQGHRILSTGEPIIKGSAQWLEITKAIQQWKESAFHPCQEGHHHQCLNAAQELEIERDHGVKVAINKRC